MSHVCTAVTNAIARGLVVPPHRDGGDTQYVETPVPADRGGRLLSDTIAWAHANLDRRITVDELRCRCRCLTEMADAQKRWHDLAHGPSG
jgi:transcriptional regulator GlxA family with amidase domain